MESKDYNAILKRANKCDYDAFFLKASYGKIGIQPEFDVNELLSQLDEWDAAHPVKTYMMDFLEKFPNAYISRGTPHCICRKEVYEGHNPCATDSYTYELHCRHCWNRPMPKKEE